MNRSFRDLNNSPRNNNSNQNYNYNYPVISSSQHRRGPSLNASTNGSISTDRERDRENENNLDLFSRTRRSISLSADHLHSQVTASNGNSTAGKLGKITTAGSLKLPLRNGLDDLLGSADGGGKHDYDWLLTPPETPLGISADRSEFRQNLAAPRSSVSTSSTTKPSRLSTTQYDNSQSSRPARSSSVTRSSVSTTMSNNYSSNRSSSILNTSSGSVSSYIRPSSPITRSSSAARPSTPSSRSTSSRPSTPSKSRSAPTISSSSDKTRPSQGSRPSTPSSRPQVSASLNFPTSRSNSRPSTPTRRNPVSSSSPSPSMSVSTGRVMSNGRSQTSTSRPSSPSPRTRSQQAVIPSDFPLDTPPNLRTTLPDRPISAGRSRPGTSLSSKLNLESSNSVNLPRRPSSPASSRGRSVEPQGRGHMHGNGQKANMCEPRKSTYVSDSARKPAKTSAAPENGSFGRTISKNSLDMAIRHMDIRNGSAGSRPLPSTSLFPQSVRSIPSKIQTAYGATSPKSANSNGSPSVGYNASILDNETYANGPTDIGKKEENGKFLGRLAAADMYESSRYDAILLKEDLKNTTWLHSLDDKSDQFSIFDGGFESLPEPFGLS